MAAALEHAEESGPRADGLTALMRHNARDLVQMREVVAAPGGEDLRECDFAQRRVQAAAIEIGRLQIQGAQFGEAFRAQAREIVQ